MDDMPNREVALAPDLGLFSILRDDGTLDPLKDPKLDDELIVRAYREIKRLRVLDARMILLQRQGRIGFYGACTGQEATPIAAALAIEPSDWVFQALRESSMMLVRGFPLSKYVAQIYGNAFDNLKGRMQPSHMSAREVNQVSWSSCMATHLPQAVGAAWAAKIRKDKTVVLAFMGDGATSEPDFQNGLNFGGVFKVPCVFICQNNHWAISVPSRSQTASETFAVKGRAYGIPSVRVDGNDFFAMYTVIKEAVDRAREGHGPTFIEAVTYRIGAHSTSDDPTRYRSQEEVERWMRRDPLLRLRRYLERHASWSDAKDEQLEKELNHEVVSAVQEVEKHGPPPADTLFDDVYSDLSWNLREQREEMRRTLPDLPVG